MLHYHGTENVTLSWDRKCYINMGQKMSHYHGTENGMLSWDRKCYIKLSENKVYNKRCFKIFPSHVSHACVGYGLDSDHHFKIYN